MAKRNFKSDQKKFTLRNWNGLNTNKDSTDIEDNQAQDLLNVIFTKDLAKRGGYTEVNSTAISGSTGIYGLFPYYYNSGNSRKLLYISHTTCGEINTATGATSSITTGLTTNLRTRAVTFKDLFIFVNGTDNPQKIDEDSGSDLGGSPPVTNFIALHKNYLFLSGNSTYPSRVYYSTLDDPETWGANDFFDVNPDDGDKIMGFAVSLDSLIIFKEYNIYVLYGDTPSYTEGLTLWRIKRAVVSTGTVSQGSVATWNRNLVYLSRNEGIRLFGGGVTSEEIDFDSMTSSLLSDDITPTVQDLNETRFNQAEAVIYDFKYIVSVPDGSSTTNNLNLVYDFRKNGWSVWNIPANCWCKYRSSGVDYLYFGSTTTGKIYRYTPTTYSDNGTAIEAYYKTKDFDLEEPAVDKRFRKFYVVVNKSSDYTLTIEPELDFGDVTPAVSSYSIGSVASDSLWGTMVWGTDKWGASTASSSDKQIMNDRAEFINYKFSNDTLNETMGVRNFTQYFKFKGSR